MNNQHFEEMQQLEEWVRLEETIIAWHRLLQRVHQMRGSHKTYLMEELIGAKMHALREKQGVILTRLFTLYNWE